MSCLWILKVDWSDEFFALHKWLIPFFKTLHSCGFTLCGIHSTLPIHKWNVTLLQWDTVKAQLYFIESRLGLTPQIIFLKYALKHTHPPISTEKINDSIYWLPLSELDSSNICTQVCGLATAKKFANIQIIWPHLLTATVASLYQNQHALFYFLSSFLSSIIESRVQSIGKQKKWLISPHMSLLSPIPPLHPNPWGIP